MASRFEPVALLILFNHLLHANVELRRKCQTRIHGCHLSVPVFCSPLFVFFTSLPNVTIVVSLKRSLLNI
jgi:hypothetical protein